MYFDLTDDQKQLGEQVDRLLSGMVDLSALAQTPESVGELGRKVTAPLAAMGVNAILVPEEHGGLGLSLLSLCVVAEHLGNHGAPGSAVRDSLAAWAIATGGTESQRKRWLEPLLTGDAHAAFALCEGQGLWAPDEWTASRSEAQGRKAYVEGLADADLVLVGLADGIGLIETAKASVETVEAPPLDMTRPWADLAFAPADCEPLPDLSAERLYDALLVLNAIDAAGAGHRAFTMAVDYAKTRSQFGRLIGSFQGLKHQLANAATDVEPLRYLCWYAAHAWDTEAEDGAQVAAVAKAHCGDIAVKTARASVEAHGGIGYTWDYPLHLLLKRAMQDRAMLGAPVRLRMRAADLAGW
jgi:alkylation response protein AidB-like acyl-CoA dehydrogenase